ncbi:MAG TPA: thioredoxin domain-containing protein [bacterium]|nr:thioredoxin domain-containing protein [bacterium]
MTSSEHFEHTNRLIHEKSPYLLQHAHNPVDWYPFGEEAFAKAKKEDKPILLSIGYSTCHWCHVMERESFEDEATAKLLNDDFVCIKVDREERPDVDQIYMNAVMALTGQGGWPLNVFLTPDLKPFYGGTYFAPDARYGRPGFPQVLRDLARVWKTQRAEVEKAGTQLAQVVGRAGTGAEGGPVKPGVTDQVLAELERGFDARDGGFRGAPKFPPSLQLQFLLRVHSATGNVKALAMVEKTLDKMAQGGIYDQVGGGFSRYSTDGIWLVPHFEKMLYDNALLARTYLEAYQVTGKEEYARIARETFTYLKRDMTSPEGAFYSAEDADSEGEEGKFYVWTPEELKKLLGEKDGTDFCSLYGATEGGNFEGRTILHLRKDLPEALRDIGRDPAWWERTRDKVLQARGLRPRPHLDDKVLTAWNALMISSLSLGYRALGDPEYLRLAEKASDFLYRDLFHQGRLLASYRQGPSNIQAYIDDYAFLQEAQLDLYESTFDLKYLQRALDLQKDMDRLFWDEKAQGYFFTGSDQKDAARLLARTKEAYDGVIPSGNSVAVLNGYRLAEFTGDKSHRDRSDAILSAFSGYLERGGSNFCKMLQAFQFDHDGPAEVFVVGPDREPALKVLWKAFLPSKVLVACEDAQVKGMVRLVPWAEGRSSQGGRTAIYVCRNYQCQLPVADPKKALELLKKK